MPTDSPTQHDSDRDRDRDRDYDKADRSDRGGSKQKAQSSSSKAKDLSHVPCKFFKVGGCTAGASCPFSHSMAEPGGQKETCAWFVKGNCKFGHKCALAHILPGQTMAMDRKNKKAAQAAAAAASGGGGEKGGKDGRGSRGKRDGSLASAGGNGARNPLLGVGSTAPTRVLHSGASGASTAGRPPMTMPLKATISPSAPAPPLKDTDFASFGTLDEMEGVKLSTAPAQGKASGSQEQEVASGATESTTPKGDAELAAEAQEVSGAEALLKSASPPVPLPPLAPRTSSNNAAADFGPIGSPPGYRSSQPTSPSRMNGTFSPGTSPRAQSHLNGAQMSSSPNTSNGGGFISSSPFSAPGSQSVFLTGSYTTGGGMGGGMAASLGSGLAMMGGRRGWGDSTDSAASSVGAGNYGGMLSTQISASATQQRPTGMGQLAGRGDFDIGFDYEDYGGGMSRRRMMAPGNEDAVLDEDLEDFIPSSLTDLLTPEERSRRMSRSNSGQGAAAGISAAAPAFNVGGMGGGAEGGAGAGGGSGLGHRYSRSVPAPSLLGDIKSIWADTSVHPMPAAPPAHQTHRGTPSSSFSSRFEAMNIGNGSNTDDMGLSMSMGSSGAPSSLGMMSPSNASAAFLPGLHHHYLNAKAKQAQQAQLGIASGLAAARNRGTSGPLFSGNGAGVPSNSIASNYLHLPSGLSSASGVHTHTHGSTQHMYRTTPSPFDLTQTLHQPQQSQTARPIPATHNSEHQNPNGGDDPLLGPHILSPSARALQAHAPGQSLPQGLAAGYSRIHALPPLTNIVSPGTPGTLAAGSSPGAPPVGGSGPYGEWQTSASPPASGANGSVGANSGLDSMFSRLSYSAAAARNGPPSHPSPPGLTRNVSGGRYPPQQQQQQTGPLSPLSRPVVTNDDDELFSMDG